MAITDAAGIVLSLTIESASAHQVGLVEKVLNQRFIQPMPERLIRDRADDSDPLDEELKQKGVEMIAPHRRNRKKKNTQDGRKLRRYKRRWIVERFFAWLFNFRRTLGRYEYKAANYFVFVLLACMKILLRYF